MRVKGKERPLAVDMSAFRHVVDNGDGYVWITRLPGVSAYLQPNGASNAQFQPNVGRHPGDLHILCSHGIYLDNVS
jgi:hypothetical protein